MSGGKSESKSTSTSITRDPYAAFRSAGMGMVYPTISQTLMGGYESIPSDPYAGYQYDLTPMEKSILNQAEGIRRSGGVTPSDILASQTAQNVAQNAMNTALAYPDVTQLMTMAGEGYSPVAGGLVSRALKSYGAEAPEGYGSEFVAEELGAVPQEFMSGMMYSDILRQPQYIGRGAQLGIAGTRLAEETAGPTAQYRNLLAMAPLYETPRQLAAENWARAYGAYVQPEQVYRDVLGSASGLLGLPPVSTRRTTTGSGGASAGTDWGNIIGAGAMAAQGLSNLF